MAKYAERRESVTVSIGAHKFKVFDCVDLRDDENATVDGLFEPDDSEILLQVHPEGIYRDEVFLHELLHAVSCMSGIELDEAEVQTFALLLVQAYQGNVHAPASMFSTDEIELKFRR